MKNLEGCCIARLFVKEGIKLLLFTISTFLLLFFSYQGLLQYSYANQNGKCLFYCFLGFVGLFTAICILGTGQALSFLLKLKKYRKEKKIQDRNERIIYWNRADILLTETSIYLMHKTFLGKIVSFSYQQLDSVGPVAKTYLVGLEVVTEVNLQFTLIDGTNYRIGYTEKKKEEWKQIKNLFLEKNARIEMKL